MFGKFTKTGFYILSYFPLYIMLLILNSEETWFFVSDFFKSITDFSEFYDTLLVKLKNPLQAILTVSSSTWFFLVLFSLILISLIFLLKFLTLKGYRSSKVSKYTQQGEDIMSYVITYLTPVLSIDINDSGVLLANFFLFIIIGIIYTKNNLIYLNPVFIIFGYNVLRDCYSQKLIVTNYNIWELRELFEDDKKVLSYKMDGSGLLLIKKINKRNKKRAD